MIGLLLLVVFGFCVAVLRLMVYLAIAFVYVCCRLVAALIKGFRHGLG